MTGGRSFRLVIVGQFLGALADGALLIVAIALLVERRAPEWTAPALRGMFYVSYVVTAAFAGAVADAWPKQRVLLVTGVVKLAGCALLLLHVHPVIAYGLVGVGAVAHSPARYGIISELVPPARRVAGNAWMEGATLAATLLGVVLASFLLESSSPRQATLALAGIYLLGALCPLAVRAQPAANPRALSRPRALLRDFAAATRLLWRDGPARTSLAVTSLFWAAAAVLQFMLLRWAAEWLGLPLADAALLQGVVSVGMIAGAAAAGRCLPVSRVLRVLPLGCVMGLAVALVAGVHQSGIAVALLACIGFMAGLLLVPMNTLLQQRGLGLMHPGQSIAVQHFGENAASLLFLAVYGFLTLLQVPVRASIVGLGAVVALAMLAVMQRRERPA